MSADEVASKKRKQSDVEPANKSVSSTDTFFSSANTMGNIYVQLY